MRLVLTEFQKLGGGESRRQWGFMSSHHLGFYRIIFWELEKFHFALITYCGPFIIHLLWPILTIDKTHKLIKGRIMF